MVDFFLKIELKSFVTVVRGCFQTSQTVLYNASELVTSNQVKQIGTSGALIVKESVSVKITVDLKYVFLARKS